VLVHGDRAQIRGETVPDSAVSDRRVGGAGGKRDLSYLFLLDGADWETWHGQVDMPVTWAITKHMYGVDPGLVCTAKPGLQERHDRSTATSRSGTHET